jgi:hypothetical protein
MTIPDTTQQTTPPAGDPVAPDAPQADAPVTPEPDATPERTYTQAEYRQVQNEAKNLRARLRELEAAQQSTAPALEATQAERDAARAELATLAEEVRGYRLRAAIADAARADETLRAADPDLVARLIEGVEWGEDGKPKGVRDGLRRLAERYPQVFAAPTATPARVGQLPAAGSNVAREISQQDVIAQKRRTADYPPL